MEIQQTRETIDFLKQPDREGAIPGRNLALSI
jgi:hypothetical protein